MPWLEERWLAVDHRVLESDLSATPGDKGLDVSSVEGMNHFGDEEAMKNRPLGMRPIDGDR